MELYSLSIFIIDFYDAFLLSIFKWDFILLQEHTYYLWISPFSVFPKCDRRLYNGFLVQYVFIG